MKLLVLLLSLCTLPSIGWAQDPQCPHLSRWVKHRLKKEARWLVSKSLQKRITKKSHAFGSLVEFQQCHWLATGLPEDNPMGDRYFTMYLVVDGVPLAAIFGRYRGIWAMAVVPYYADGKMPNANLLEITERKWTLIHRDKDGSRNILATENY